MPSDLTISKLEGTTAPPVSSKTREELIMESHQKVAAREQYPNVFDESLPDVAEQIGLIQAANTIAQNEYFWNPQARAEANDTFLRNTVSGIVGLPADTIKLMYDAWRMSPGGAVAPSSEDTLLEAFTSERIAESIGGDPTHASFLPSQLLAPGPGEFKSIFVGARGMARKGGDEIKRLDDFLQKGGADTELDLPLFQETGWFKGRDGQVRMWMNPDEITWRMREQLEGAKKYKDAVARGKEFYGKLNLPLEQIMDHPKLYEAYPELRNLPVSISYRHHPEKGLQWFDRNVPETNLGDLQSLRVGEETFINRLNGYHADARNPIEETIYHEVQHAIQMLEGFAKGGNSKMPQRAMDDLRDALDFRQALDVVNEGKTTPDEIIEALVFDRGFDETRAALIASDKDLAAYIGALDDLDQFTIQGIEDGNASIINLNSNELSWLLEYAEPNGATQDQVDTLLGMLKPETARATRNAAYKNLHGEAEARLAGALMRLRIDPNVSKRTVPDPQIGPGTTKDRPLTEQGRRTNPESTIVTGNPDDRPSLSPKDWEKTFTLNEKKILDEFPDITPDRIATNRPAAAALNDGVNDVYISNTAFGTQRAKKRVEVLKNPTPTSLRKWGNKYFRGKEAEYPEGPLMRVITDVEGNIYMWPAEDALHDDFIKKTGIVAHWGDDWTDVDGMSIDQLADMKEKGLTWSELENYK